jgi:dihydrofolate reductase
MSKLRAQLAVSLDGFAAGPNQSEEEPLGEGGENLHDWLIELGTWQKAHGREAEGEVNASTVVAEELEGPHGAVIMGRKMFGPIGGGDWGDGSWKGWWGDDPPYHSPVFVLTHHAREPVEMEGGTTFHFVTDGIESALEQAREVAGDKDILIAGGASAVQQYLAAGLLDELQLSISPMLLGSGERPLVNLGDSPPKLELLRTIDAPGVTHVKYAVS